MEIAQSGKGTGHNQLQQSIFVIGEICLKNGSRKHFGRDKVKVKLRSHQDIAHLDLPTNMSTSYQPPISYYLGQSIYLFVIELRNFQILFIMFNSQSII